MRFLRFGHAGVAAACLAACAPQTSGAVVTEDARALASSSAPSSSAPSSPAPLSSAALTPIDAGVPRICSEVGCSSDVSLIAHIDASPQTLAAGHASIRLCHQHECWDARVAPPSPGNPPELFACAPTTSGAFQVWCFVRAEGTGSTIEAKFAAIAASNAGPSGFVDGDRVSVRIALAGRVLIDHARFVRYEDRFPNGKACAPVCRNAAIEIYPATPSGATCGVGTCTAFARFETTVPMTADGAGDTRVNACKNGTCNTAHVVLWNWVDGKAAPLMAGAMGVGPIARDGTQLEIYPRPNGMYLLRVTFPADTRALRPGDQYAIDWRSASGRVLMHADQVVAAYDESFPGGPGCAPFPCRQKTFVVPAAMP